MKTWKILLVHLFISLLCTLSTSAQDYIKITNGFSTVQIKVNSSTEGTLYYVIYTSDLATIPLASDLKALALNTIITNIQKKGTLKVSADYVGDTLVQSIVNMPLVTNNTPKLYYIYTVFENKTGVLGVVKKQTLTFTRKQPAYTFKSTTLSTTELTTVNYLVYLPESYYHNTNKKYPMVVFFHGDGQKGDNIDQVRTDALPNYIDGGMNFDFIVVSPQQNGWKQTWDKPSFVQELIDLSKLTYRVDSLKIYGIGCSGGGGGMYRYALQYPNTFAAMSAISGTNIFNNNICIIKNIPFWGFHSLNDGTVVYNGFKNIVNDLTACGPITPVKKTVYNSTAHDCWKWALKQDSVYKFLLAKNKSFKTNEVIHMDIDTNITVFPNSQGIAEVDINTVPFNGAFEYYWIQTGGPDATLINTSQKVFSILNPIENQTYKFRLVLKRTNENQYFKNFNIKIGAVVTESNDNVVSGTFGNWKILKMNGELVKEGFNSSVNTKDLLAGFYILQTEQKAYKFVVTH